MTLLLNKLRKFYKPKHLKRFIITISLLIYKLITFFTQTLTFSLQSLEKLQSLNIFKDIRIHLDTCRDKLGKVEGVEVTYHVKESGRVATSLSATAGSQTGDAVSIMYNDIIMIIISSFSES